ACRLPPAAQGGFGGSAAGTPCPGCRTGHRGCTRVSSVRRALLPAKTQDAAQQSAGCVWRRCRYLAGGVPARGTAPAGNVCRDVPPAGKLTPEGLMNPEQAKAMADAFLDGIQREFAITRKVIAAIPEDQKGFKLGEKGRTAAEIAWHIVLTEAWFAESLIAGSFGAESPAPADATVAEMVDWYDKNVPGLTEKVKALSGEDF